MKNTDKLTVDLDSKEVRLRRSNVTSIQEAFLLRWAKRILKGDYKITYLDGKSNDNAPDSVRPDLHTEGKD